jgi:protein Tex
VVKSGDVVRVKVLAVDPARNRISLTLRLDDEGPPPQAARRAPRPAGGRDRAEDRPASPSGRVGRTGSGSPPRSGARDQAGSGEGALADALRRAGLVGDKRRDDRNRK